MFAVAVKALRSEKEAKEARKAAKEEEKKREEGVILGRFCADVSE